MTPAEVPPDEARETGAGLPPSETIARAVLERADDDHLGLVAGELRLTHAEVVARAAQRAAWLRAQRVDGPFHVAVLLDNVAEFVFWLEAAALVGAVVVGANPTHRGDELARDLVHTECQLLVTESAHLPLVEGARLAPALGTVALDNDRVLVLDTERAQTALAPFAGTAADRRGGAHASRPTPWATSSSPPAPRAHRKPACAARDAWPGSATSWASSTRSCPRTCATCPCLCSTPTP